jgi:hypothetical protein
MSFLLNLAKDHRWTASFDSQEIFVKLLYFTTLDSLKHQNSWCPYRYCAGQVTNTLDIAKMVAINKGGDCISNK